jgi:hypothetical protein
MTSKADKELLKQLKAAHEKKYNAPWGKRKCRYKYSKSCLGIAPEMDSDGDLQWRGHMCRECKSAKQADRYTERLTKEGKERTGPGRPIGSKNKTKKKNTKKATKKTTKKKSKTA